MNKFKEEKANCRSLRMERKEKSKMIDSCRFLQDEQRQCSKEQGVTMADS